MLTAIVLVIQPRWWHWLMWLLGVRHEDFQDMLDGLCPCEVTR